MKSGVTLESLSLTPTGDGSETQPTVGTDRLVYPYSVVPGGVITPGEVERAMARDPVVASHYAGVNLRSLRVVRLHEVRDAYVSYRIGDQVYWTSKKLRLKVNEAVLTDGNITVRARCGNRIADTPLGPTSAAEPSVESFDSPADPATDPAVLAASPAGSGGAAKPGGAVLAASEPDAPAAENEWASATDSSQHRGRVLLGPGGGRSNAVSGSGSPGPDEKFGGDPTVTFGPGPAPHPGPHPPSDPNPKPTGDPDPGPNPGPGPGPGPNPDPNPGPDPGPDPKPGPRSIPDPGPPPRNDPRPPPPPSRDPDDDPVPVPEPTTLVLVGIGAGSAVIRHLRKRRSAER